MTAKTRRKWLIVLALGLALLAGVGGPGLAGRVKSTGDLAFIHGEHTHTLPYADPGT